MISFCAHWIFTLSVSLSPILWLVVCKRVCICMYYVSMCMGAFLTFRVKWNDDEKSVYGQIKPVLPICQQHNVSYFVRFEKRTKKIFFWCVSSEIIKRKSCLVSAKIIRISIGKSMNRQWHLIENKQSKNVKKIFF